MPFLLAVALVLGLSRAASAQVFHPRAKVALKKVDLKPVATPLPAKKAVAARKPSVDDAPPAVKKPKKIVASKKKKHKGDDDDVQVSDDSDDDVKVSDD